MDFNTGRPNHIGDYLAQLHSGQWFGWTNSKNKIYANLKLSEKVGIEGNIVDNLITELPTEQECIDGLATIQADFDAKQYQRDRAKEYPTWQDQLDDIYHNGVDGWKATIKATKDKYPKP